MTLEEQRELSFYRPVTFLNEERGVELVQHAVSKRVFVKKVLEVYDRRVFQYLQEHPVTDTPRIYCLAEDSGKLNVIEEYINGRALQEILDEEGAMEPERARRIIIRLCKILRDLHSAEPPIIHRDIKPSNVLISEDGRVVLIDMNAAKYYRSGPARDTRLIGTHGYAAPEQYGFGVSDERTDIYALGVLMNVMLTGQLPSVAPAAGPEGEWIGRCVQMDPKDRFSSMDEALAELDPGQGERRPGKPRDEAYLKSFLPPGFRTRSPGKMISAALGYGLLAMGIAFGEFGDNPAVENIYRVSACIISVLIILLCGNYRNIQGILHISAIPQRWLRVLMLVVLSAGIFCFGIIGLSGVLELAA